MDKVEKSGRGLHNGLSDSNAVPVIAGLAVGFLFVAIFALTFDSIQRRHVALTDDDVVITLSGLQSRYGPNEGIDFVISAKGEGLFCEKPVVQIIDTDSNNLALPISNGGLCENVQSVDASWTKSDLWDAPLTLGIVDGPGHYRMEVHYNGAVLEHEFIINDGWQG